MRPLRINKPARYPKVSVSEMLSEPLLRARRKREKSSGDLADFLVACSCAHGAGLWVTWRPISWRQVARDRAGAYLQRVGSESRVINFKPRLRRDCTPARPALSFPSRLPSDRAESELSRAFPADEFLAQISCSLPCKGIFEKFDIQVDFERMRESYFQISSFFSSRCIFSSEDSFWFFLCVVLSLFGRPYFFGPNCNNIFYIMTVYQ